MIEASPDTSILAALGMSIKTIVGGAIGSFISLRFYEDLRIWEKWITFIGGWGMGAALGLPLVSYFDLKPIWHLGVALLVATFCMSLVSAVIKAIREINLGAIITDAITRLTGGPKS